MRLLTHRNLMQLIQYFIFEYILERRDVKTLKPVDNDRETVETLRKRVQKEQDDLGITSEDIEAFYAEF